MIRSAAFVIIITLRIFYQPGNAQASIDPFVSHPPISTASSSSSAKLISFTGNFTNNKVLLEWSVSENEGVDQFEVEKSTDGKNFTLAALVFGTDKAETGKYQFYEKAGNQKIMYRLKLIHKDKKAEYSTVMELTSTV